MSDKTVVVTGGAGYIGAVLCPLLVDAGYQVRVLDRFFWGDTLPDSPRIEKIKVDSRQISPQLLDGVYAVLDLAAISNDPAGELDPVKTLDINYRARRRLQEIAADQGVDRYVLASSCSIYGFQDEVVDENSPTNPLTTYAEANLRAEQSALELHRKGDPMAVVLFRQATMYGLSRRMRFDIAVNGMTLGMWQDGSIPLLRDGTQWRPMIHIRDTAKAFILALAADKSTVAGECFNVGSNEQNYQILQLGELVAAGIGTEFNHTWYGAPDHRSYRVSFDKIRDVLGFTPDWTPDRGAAEIAAALDAGTVTPDIQTKTLAWYSELIDWAARIRDIAPDGTIL